MRVLVACEESGTVRDAFLAAGHDAYSCDLQPSRGNPSRHIQGDALQVAYDSRWQWELMIAHPPCTEFSGSGSRWRTDHWVQTRTGPYWHDGTRKRQLQHEALLFVQLLWLAPIPRKAMENPQGELSSLFRKPDQYIHPWQYGHPEFKKTGLWLDGLPLLQPTQILTPPSKEDEKQYNAWSVVHRAVPSPTRARDRAVTYKGWASAMAAQWGSL